MTMSQGTVSPAAGFLASGGEFWAVIVLLEANMIQISLVGDFSFAS